MERIAGSPRFAPVRQLCPTKSQPLGFAPMYSVHTSALPGSRPRHPPRHPISHDTGVHHFGVAIVLTRTAANHVVPQHCNSRAVGAVLGEQLYPPIRSFGRSPDLPFLKFFLIT